MANSKHKMFGSLIFRILLVASVGFLSACGGTSIFTAIGTKLANPLTVAVDSTTARAYVVNANNKVLYTGGSLHVVNIAAPASPVRVNSVALDSFGGQVVRDPYGGAPTIYVPNRLSESVDDKADHVVRVDVNEAATTFLATTAFDAAGDPFGAAVAVVGAVRYLLVPTREGVLNYYDLTLATPTAQSVDLKRTLSDGTTLTTVDATQLAVIGSQAVIARASGGLLVVNLNELAGGTNPVDYFIGDLGNPRGLATDGTRVYVTNVETASDGTKTNSLFVLNLATLTVDPANTTTTVKDKDTDGLLAATIAMGNDPQQVVVGTTEGFVANQGDDTVTVFNRAAPATTATVSIAVGDEPFGLALYSPGGVDTDLLVCNVQSNTVSIIDIPSRTVVGTYQ